MKYYRRVVIAVVCAIGCVAAVVIDATAPASSEPALQAGTYDPSTVIVKLRAGSATAADASRVAATHGVGVRKRLGHEFVSVSTGGRAVGGVLRSLAADDRVEAVSPNYIRTSSAAVTPDDPGFGQQDELRTARFPDAWGVVSDASAVTVAVLDSGVEATHPDLAARLLAGIDEIDGDTVPQDDFGHGTRVAGIVGAVTGNATGIAGGAFDTRVMPVRVLDAQGGGTDDKIVAGIVWAVDHGADVINMSFGGSTSSPILDDAIAYAQSHDVVVVAAAGNAGSSTRQYPAASPGVLAVGATTTSGDAKASFSQYGTWIDLTAVGVEVYSTARFATFDSYSGTSFSSPQVAAAAALVRAKYPSWTADQVAAALTSTARDIGATGKDSVFGYGALDAFAAVSLTAAPVVATTTTTTTTAAPTTTTPTTTVPPSPPPRSGYWMVDAAGGVYAFGDAKWMGNGGVGNVDAVDLEPTPSGKGYWIVDALGRVYAFGDAGYFGGAGPLRASERVTSLSRTPSGGGYWISTSLGRVIPFGNAPFLGDMAGTRLNGPVLDSIPTPSGKGYYMVASDGGIFTFGDAGFRGSMGSVRLNAPVQSLVPDSDGDGYWLVASDGGIFAFAAPFYGSMGAVQLNRPVTGMVGFRSGYVMVGEDGGIFTFGDAPYLGSLGNNPPARPVASVAPLAE